MTLCSRVYRYGIDVDTDDPHGRHYKFVSPNFRMVKNAAGPVFSIIGEQQFIRWVSLCVRVPSRFRWVNALLCE